MGVNEELVQQIQCGDPGAMALLWEKNKNLVSHIANRYHTGDSRHYEKDDLMQAGYLGLYSAALLYHPERGAAFSSYAVLHLSNAMREVAGLRGKRDPILDASSLDAPLGEDGEDTFGQLVPAEQNDDPLELEELGSIMRAAVDRMENKEAREAISAVYFAQMPVVQYASFAGICNQAAHGRLQRGYEILRRDKAIISLAIAEGYRVTRSPLDDLCTDGGRARSGVEAAVMRKDEEERQKTALHKQLGNLMDIPLPGRSSGGK